jgi:hypothetical protein
MGEYLRKGMVEDREDYGSHTRPGGEYLRKAWLKRLPFNG